MLLLVFAISAKLLKCSNYFDALRLCSHNPPVSADTDSNNISVDACVIKQMLLERNPTLLAVERLSRSCPSETGRSDQPSAHRGYRPLSCGSTRLSQTSFGYRCRYLPNPRVTTAPLANLSRSSVGMVNRRLSSSFRSK